MRRSRAHAFYLAIFGLFSTTCHARSYDSATRASSGTTGNPDVCAIEPKARVSDACASYADLDALNTALRPAIADLTNATDFFAYYRLNLYNKACPFWSDETGMCSNIACAVTTLDDEESVPPIWRAEELSKLEGPKAQHPGRVQQRERSGRPLQGELGEKVGESCVVEIDDECDERDYCVPEDESASAKGDYVSLVDNPERFTGYSGEAAHQVWEAIYRENCFSRPAAGRGGEARRDAGEEKAGTSPFGLAQNQAQAAFDFKHVIKAYDRAQAKQSAEVSGGKSLSPFDDGSLEIEDECVEKRVFYRIISGMHASISTHLCHSYLNQTTGEWGPNLQCYVERLHRHPERIANLYFNYALVLRAVGKLREFVPDYTFCTGDAVEDARTKALLLNLAKRIPGQPQRIFDETIMFRDQTASGLSLKEDFRNRFRNVSRIMDCVGCDKCRLWGKIQINGLGTAMKVLFEFDEFENLRGGVDGGRAEIGAPWLRRTELVALVNTLDKISAALAALEEFRGMVAAEQEAEEHGSAPSPRSPPAAIADEKKTILPVREPEYSSSSSHEANTNPDDSDDYENSDDDDNDINFPQPTFTQSLTAEFGLVFETMWLIVRTWMRLPKTLALVFWAELTRGVNAFLGRPARDRVWTWSLTWPDYEELRQRMEL